MKDFAKLLEKLILTPSRNRKVDLLAAYFINTPDPDRGIALSVLTANFGFDHVKSSKIKELVMQKVDENLFKLSYDYVGDLGETVALIWPDHNDSQTSNQNGVGTVDAPDSLPSLADFVNEIETTPKKDKLEKLRGYLNIATANERWAIIKMMTGGLRIGVSERLAKTALAKMSGQDLQDIEEIWHGLSVPYMRLFKWLDGKDDKPIIKHTETFHPMMLSNPIDEDKDFEKLDSTDFQVEWKWDGIRVQLVMGADAKALYSRTGDDISRAFPDIVENVNGAAVLDGELLVGEDFNPATFNNLQQRLNRKTVTKKMLDDYPAFIRIYDILFDGDEDIRAKTLLERRQHLEAWFKNNSQTRLDLSEVIDFKDWDDLASIRRDGADKFGHEGVMIKHKGSQYVPGRPKGLWYKWKRDPNFVDAILMYAQRGHGKRSSFYSDYTFGVWKGNDIVPIGKAYFGFTDEELKQLDKFVRTNTVNRFGPVREVKKDLVLEVAFDSAHESPRHKSGIALRFPRISRIRWDKPAQEAETLEGMQMHIS